MNTVKFDKGNRNVKMVAHRGVSGLERENTCSAFVAAGNRSHFGIETDVHVTKDGKFIIIHDDNTSRVGVDSLHVEETTFQTLRSLQLLNTDGQRSRADLCLPSLDEYVGICKKYEKIGVLELKNRMTVDNIRGILQVIDDMDYLSGIIFISFDIENLYDLRKICPEARAQWLCCSCEDDLLDNLAAHKLDMDVLHDALTEERIKAAHDRGITVNCWTVDDPKRAEDLTAWGVDMITSNILE